MPRTLARPIRKMAAGAAPSLMFFDTFCRMSTIFCAAFLLRIASAGVGGAGAGAPPHVIFIVADDLGWADVSFTGFSDVRTPHIDALHAGGLRLTRYYGQPVCSPSRAAIHTGRLPLAMGLQTYVIDPEGVDYGLDLNETTLPQLLRDKGGCACCPPFPRTRAHANGRRPPRP